MSVKIMSLIFETECLKPTKRLILLALADHANDEGECYPSIERLCLRTGLGERTVQNNIRQLTEAGFLEIETGGGRKNCNLYRIKTPHIFTKTPQQMHPAADAPPNKTPHIIPKTPHIFTKNPAYFYQKPRSRCTRTIKKHHRTSWWWWWCVRARGKRSIRG